MTDYTENFERAWRAYPKRNGKKIGKRPAFNQWQRLSAEDRSAAFQEIEKRNRQGTWGKYIKDMQRYLRDHGWDDEVESPQTDLLARKQYAPPEPQLGWMERYLNRIYVAYVRTARGLDDHEPALNIKHEVLHEGRTFQEEIEVEEDDEKRRTLVIEAADVLGELFLSRLDQAYGLKLADRCLS